MNYSNIVSVPDDEQQLLAIVEQALIITWGGGLGGDVMIFNKRDNKGQISNRN